MKAKGVITRIRRPRRLRERTLVDVKFDGLSCATLYDFDPDGFSVGDTVILEIHKPETEGAKS